MSSSVLTRKHTARVCLLLLGVLLILNFVALAVGAVSIPLPAVGSAVWEVLTGAPSGVSQAHRDILGYRLARILLAMIVGAALGVAGAGYQALLRNPLADPYVLGVSSGAALGAILSLAFIAQIALATPVAAFVGATLTITAVYFLGQRGAELSPYTLLLAGIITASFLSGIVIVLLNSLSGRALRGFLFWLIGDLSNPPALPHLGWLALACLLAVGVIYGVAGELNLLLGGEAEAQTLGVNVRRTKLLVYLTASFATGLAVSFSGAIGYVGLVVPHLVRLLFGSDYRLLVPAAALTGAVVLVAADTLARTVVAPTELPVGAVTAVVGAPVFLYLLRWRLPGGGSGGGV
ncbi:MAG: iron ABC transporter permease [Candidatus Acidoferrales bacterium]